MKPTLYLFILITIMMRKGDMCLITSPLMDCYCDGESYFFLTCQNFPHMERADITSLYTVSIFVMEPIDQRVSYPIEIWPKLEELYNNKNIRMLCQNGVCKPPGVTPSVQSKSDILTTLVRNSPLYNPVSYPPTHSPRESKPTSISPSQNINPSTVSTPSESPISGFITIIKDNSTHNPPTRRQQQQASTVIDTTTTTPTIQDKQNLNDSLHNELWKLPTLPITMLDNITVSTYSQSPKATHGSCQHNCEIYKLLFFIGIGLLILKVGIIVMLVLKIKHLNARLRNVNPEIEMVNFN
jgi:hypothetical protein